jgi:hypothetical protein
MAPAVNRCQQASYFSQCSELRDRTEINNLERRSLRRAPQPTALPDGRFTARTAPQLIGRPRSRFTGWPDHRFTGWPVDRLAGRPDDQGIGWLDGGLIGCWPGHRLPGFRGRRLAGCRVQRLTGWSGRRLLGWLVDREWHNFTDNEEKNYPDQRARQRVEKEIFQCTSLANWQHQLDNGANDISSLLNDTSKKAIIFNKSHEISKMDRTG